MIGKIMNRLRQIAEEVIDLRFQLPASGPLAGTKDAQEPLLLPAGTYRTLFCAPGVLATYKEIVI